MFTSLASDTRHAPAPVPVPAAPGRDREFARLGTALDRCFAGRGGVLTLHGSVGSGRTELLHTFGEFAASRGALVLSATGAPLERDFALGVARQLFQSPGLDPDVEDEAARLVDDGVTDSPRLAPAGPTGDAPAPVRPAPRTLRQLSALALGLAERAPLVLAVDDRQDADVQSLEFLLYLVRRTRGARVLTVLASRETMTPPDPYFEVDLARQPHHERVRLGLMTQDVVAALLRERLGGATARHVAAAHDLTGGNPLLVRALAEDQEPDLARVGHAVHATRAGLVVGENYRRGLMDCLHRIDPLALRCARGVAVFGRPVEPVLLAELLLLAPDSLTRAMYLLHAAGLFRDGNFRHESGAGDLLAAMRPEELAALHHRAARLLRGSGAPDAYVTEQLRAAEGQVRAPWAVADPGTTAAGPVDPVEVAAPVPDTHDERRTASRESEGMPQEAFFQALLTATAPTAATASTVPGASTDVATAAPDGMPVPDAGSGPLPQSADEDVVVRCVPWLADGDTEGELTPKEKLTSLRYLFWHGRTADGLDGLARFERDHADGPESSDRLRLWLDFWYPSLLRRAAAPAAAPGAGAETRTRFADTATSPLRGGPVVTGPERVHRDAGPADGMRTLVALLAGDPVDALVRQAERTLREARLGGMPLESVTAALTVLLYADRADLAARWCPPPAEAGRPDRDATRQALLSALTAETALRQGDLRAAEESARAAFLRIRPDGWGVAVGFPLATMISARTALGRPEDAARYAALPVPDAMYETPAGLHYLYARGEHRLAVGRAEEALADFRACGETMALRDLDHLPGLVPWRIGAARAQLALGRPESARALAERQLAVPGAGPGAGQAGQARVRGMALRVRAAAGEQGERVDLLDRAVAALETSGDRRELAAALSELSTAHDAQGDPIQARTYERRARHVTRTSDPGQPDQEPSGESAADELSDAERRVAELAARGLTNREISRNLYITVSTVEQHLTRVYRKLGLRRRVDLRYFLAPDRGLAG